MSRGVDGVALDVGGNADHFALDGLAETEGQALARGFRAGQKPRAALALTTTTAAATVRPGREVTPPGSGIPIVRK